MKLWRSFRSEWAKALSTSMWWVFALLLFAFVAVNAAVRTNALGPQTLPPGVGASLLALPADSGYVFAVIFGSLLVTAEFRHRTLATTFLATPRRWIPLTAKAAVAVLFGTFYGIVASAASLLISGAILVSNGSSPDLQYLSTWTSLAKVLLVYALWALIGLGLGALVRSQSVAIAIALVFVPLLEPLLQLSATYLPWVPAVEPYLPSAASVAILSVNGSAQNLLTPWWMGAVVLFGYQFVLLVLARVTSWRRDAS